MNEFLRWAAGTLVLAAVVHLAVILVYPYAAMNQLMAGIEELAGGPNQATFPPRPDHMSRRVVRPSPDLLYALCVYDVSRAPVQVSVPVADTYWSLSLYAANTDNFYVVSEVGRGAASASVIIAAAGTDVSDIRLPVVTPPSKRGLALYRLLIDSPRRLAAFDALRRKMECTSLGS